MKAPKIQSTKKVVPMIYAYTTPEVARHDGWTKIGQTEQDVETRIRQQTQTADIAYHIEWKGVAIFDDGSGDRFTDKDFHAYLRASGVEQEEGKNNEWFHVTGKRSKAMFDTFRALHPLLAIIAPSLSAQMVQSLVTMAEEGGWLPIFPCWNSYTAAMIGDHCSSIIADAYVKGIKGPDYATAYRFMRQNAFDAPTTEQYTDGMGRRALQSYLHYGFIPLEDHVADAFHTHEQTSRTLEYAYDDFCVAQLARHFGTEADLRALLERSQNWRHVINPATGWADGRHADGSWENNTDLTHRKQYITEGATCHYTWFVPHDVPALIQAMGGPRRFEQKLDSMFTQHLYWHGNEPCHQIAYLYNYVGRPDKTRQWVHHILDTEYADTPGGLSGNDDAGQMSAWYIFSAIGFYPVCPGTPSYQLGAPVFRRVTLNLENGQRFVIKKRRWPKKNGSRFTLLHSDILCGGKLIIR